MNIIKKGIIKKNEKGGYILSGYTFDCEGGSVNIDKMVELALKEVPEAK